MFVVTVTLMEISTHSITIARPLQGHDLQPLYDPLPASSRKGSIWGRMDLGLLNPQIMSGTFGSVFEFAWQFLVQKTFSLAFSHS